MRLSMRENSWPAYIPAARLLRALITQRWCSWAQHHTNSYQLVEKGCDHIPQQEIQLSHFPSKKWNKTNNLLCVFALHIYQLSPSLPVQPAARHMCVRKSANSSEMILTIYSNQHPAERVSALPFSGSSADSTAWDPEGDTSRPEQLTSSPASTPTGWLTGGLTEWLGGRLDDWETDYHSAGGSRTEKATPHTDQLTRCLAAGMDGRLV